MTIQSIHELFLTKQSNDIIEVFNCYDYRYGNIFCNGELVYSFYKEMYTDVLESYFFIKDLEDNNIDIQNATVIIYNLEPLRDYVNNMTVFEPEIAGDYSYEELRDNINTDLVAIEQAITTEKKNSKYFQFTTVQPLSDFL